MATNYDFNPAVFDKRVVLLKEIVKVGEFGSPQSYWQPFARVWASIEPMSGKEYWTASQSQGEASIRIVIRYIGELTNRMRVLYKRKDGTNTTFELKSPPINKLEGNKYIELMCRELAENES